MKKQIVVDGANITRTCTACSKETSYTRLTKPIACPICGDKYWDKPPDERNLFLLQDEYLANGRKTDDLGKMYPLIFNYAKNIVVGSVKHKIFLDEEDIEEKSEDIATTFLEKYLNDSEYITLYSFGAMLIKISKGILYSKRVVHEDANFSLEKKLEDNFTIQDNPAYFISDPEAKEQYEKNAYDEYEKTIDKEVIPELDHLIKEIYARVLVSQTRSDSFLFLIGLRNFFLLDESRVSMEEFYNYCGNTTRQTIENTKLFIRRYLVDRMKA